MNSQLTIYGGSSEHFFLAINILAYVNDLFWRKFYPLFPLFNPLGVEFLKYFPSACMHCIRNICVKFQVSRASGLLSTLTI